MGPCKLCPRDKIMFVCYLLVNMFTGRKLLYRQDYRSQTSQSDCLRAVFFMSSCPDVPIRRQIRKSGVGLANPEAESF